MTEEEFKSLEKEYMILRRTENKTIKETIRMKDLYEILRIKFGSLI